MSRLYISPSNDLRGAEKKSIKRREKWSEKSRKNSQRRVDKMQRIGVFVRYCEKRKKEKKRQ